MSAQTELKRILARHQDRLFRQARRIVGNDQDARDVLQIVFLRLVKMLPELPPNTGYLIRAVWNESASVLRERVVKRRVFAEPRTPRDGDGEEEDGPVVDIATRSAEQAFERAALREYREPIVSAMPGAFRDPQLSDAHREILAVVCIEDVPHRMATEILDIDETTVRTRKHDALFELGRLVSERIGGTLQGIEGAQWRTAVDACLGDLDESERDGVRHALSTRLGPIDTEDFRNASSLAFRLLSEEDSVIVNYSLFEELTDEEVARILWETRWFRVANEQGQKRADEARNPLPSELHTFPTKKLRAYGRFRGLTVALIPRVRGWSDKDRDH